MGSYQTHRFCRAADPIEDRTSRILASRPPHQRVGACPFRHIWGAKFVVRPRVVVAASTLPPVVKLKLEGASKQDTPRDNSTPQPQHSSELPSPSEIRSTRADLEG